MSRLIASLLMLAAVSAARANYGSVGGLVGEPTGLGSVKIVRETLTIDMRAFDGSRPEDMLNDWPVVNVEVVYQLWNAGEARTVDLVFVSGSMVDAKEVQVWLKDTPLAIDNQVGQDDPLRKSLRDRYRPPEQTPGIGEKHPLYYPNWGSGERFSRISPTIPHGDSVLRTVYRSSAGRNGYHGSPTTCWQFAYILSPAREWGGFGGLDVKVLVPPDWRAATNLRLHRDGDVLSGSFDEIPADDLSLTIQFLPTRLERLSAIYSWAAYIMLGVAPVVVLFIWIFVRRSLARKCADTERIGCLEPWSILAGFGCGAIAFLTAYLLTIAPVGAPDVPALQRNSGQNWIQVIAFAFIGIPVSFLTWILAIVLTRRNTSKSRPNPPLLPAKVHNSVVEIPEFPSR